MIATGLADPIADGFGQDAIYLESHDEVSDYLRSVIPMLMSFLSKVRDQLRWIVSLMRLCRSRVLAMLLVLADYLAVLNRVLPFSVPYVTFNSGSLNRTTHCSACRSVGYSLSENRQIGQSVRLDGPKSHFSKQGTPTMGGVLILVCITASTLCGPISQTYTSGSLCW